jgi:hypothetical protein
MNTRKHAVVRKHRRGPWIALAAACVLVALAGGAAWAGYRYEQNRSARLLPGIGIAGVNVSGMTRSQAERALGPSVSAILDREITVRARGKTWDLTAEQLGTTVDVQGALDKAFALSRRMSWTSRLMHRLFGRPVDRSFDFDVGYRRDVVGAFVRSVARTIHVAPQGASLDFVDGRLVVQHSRSGRSLRTEPAVASLMEALRNEGDSVALGTRTVRPRFTDDTLGMTIIIRLSLNRLFLYDGLKLLKSYPVATGQPQYPTPAGHWSIVNKRINPTWVNPAKDTWGADEPDFIPPGPDNPLGTRALDLDAPGIRIHGTPNDASIGHYASHGCIRMHIWDSEDLYPRVPVGTRVIIAA